MQSTATAYQLIELMLNVPLNTK